MLVTPYGAAGMGTAVTYEGLIKAAEREHAAERNRTKAEAAWRAAWWKTTLALVDVPNGDGATLNLIAEKLGQSRKRIEKRRRVGRRTARIAGDPVIYTVPPELAIEWADEAQRDLDLIAANKMIHAERNGMSRREFAVEIGTAREGVDTAEQRREAPATPHQIRRALADPAVVREVMADPQTREVVNRVENERVNQRFAQAPIERTESTQRADDLAADTEWVAEISKAGGVLATAQALMADAPKSSAARRRGLAALRDLLNRAEAMRDVLALDMDAELERMTRDQ